MNNIAVILNDFFKNDNGTLNIYGKALKIVFIIVLTRITNSMINKLINRTLRNKKGTNASVSDRRVNTLGQMIKSLVKNFLYFIGLVIILDMFDINTTSILATAGIGGLAIGFGAQSLVKDFITGVFILWEDQYAVGDYIKIDAFEGVVEELGIRVTKLRDFSGELHIIPNGNIKIVTNKTRGPMRALVKISIAYEEDIDKAIKVLERVCEEVKAENNSIVEGPSIMGVTDLGESGISITIVAKTLAMDQWSLERQIRKRVKETFDKENIEIPYPKRIIVGGKEK